MKKYKCANPAKNPKCSGTTTTPGGLCRSCGIRAAKAGKADVPGTSPARARAGSGDHAAGRFRCASGCGEAVERDGTYCPGCSEMMGGKTSRGEPATEKTTVPRSGVHVPATIRPVAPPPTPPGAADGPGPLTLALVDFFAECGKASERVEASMVLEHRQMTIQVKFALPN